MKRAIFMNLTNEKPKVARVGRESSLPQTSRRVPRHPAGSGGKGMRCVNSDRKLAKVHKF